MIPPKKSPAMIALDMVAAPSKKTSSDSYEGAPPPSDDAGSDQDPDAAPKPAENPESLLDSIQSQIEKLRAALSA